MIYGERIRLRGVEKADLPRFVEWLNDPEVLQGLLLHNPLSLTEEENWYQRMLERPTDEHVMVIDARLPANTGENPAWKLIGSLAFNHIDWRVASTELGIMIGDKSYWNQGYGTEAVRLLVKHGFNTLNLNRIFLHVYETNPRAIRAYEKVGFTLEGRERQAEFKEGRYIDVLRMSILKAEFSESNARTDGRNEFKPQG
jgi:diamine N-acetyltransferase